MNQPYQHELAQLYDVAVPNWPGEIAFYRRFARQASSCGLPILELGCGTGRVAVKLAQAGNRVVGVDLSDEMLAIAETKSVGFSNLRWVKADMRSFELDESFGLVIVPAYSFQLLLTGDDQAACLKQIARHLSAEGRLIVHLERHSPAWLDSLPTEAFTDFTPAGKARHPGPGQMIQVSYALSFDPEQRDLAVNMRYEVLSASGAVVHQTDRGPLHMVCTRTNELETLLDKAGWVIEAVYGDFFEALPDEDANDLIYVIRKA